MDLETAITRCSPAVAEKGKRLFQAGRVRQDQDYPDVFWVGSGSEAGREYRVQLYQHFSSCSCKHGIHTGAGATCAHPIAAMTYVKENKIDLWPEHKEAGEAAEGGPSVLIEFTDEGTKVRRLRQMTGTDDAELPEEPF
jgi:hypothetical protein